MAYIRYVFVFLVLPFVRALYLRSFAFICVPFRVLFRYGSRMLGHENDTIEVFSMAIICNTNRINDKCK